MILEFTSVTLPSHHCQFFGTFHSPIQWYTAVPVNRLPFLLWSRHTGPLSTTALSVCVCFHVSVNQCRHLSQPACNAHAHTPMPACNTHAHTPMPACNTHAHTPMPACNTQHGRTLSTCLHARTHTHASMQHARTHTHASMQHATRTHTLHMPARTHTCTAPRYSISTCTHLTLCHLCSVSALSFQAYVHMYTRTYICAYVHMT